MIACADPTDPTVVDELRGTLGLDVRLAVATEAAILEAIERYFGAGSTAVQKVIETMGEDERGEESGGEDLTSLRDMAFDAPVVRLVNLLIENAIKAGASDIHIEPFEDSAPRPLPDRRRALRRRDAAASASRRRSPRASRSWRS